MVAGKRTKCMGRAHVTMDGSIYCMLLVPSNTGDRQRTLVTTPGLKLTSNTPKAMTKPGPTDHDSLLISIACERKDILDKNDQESVARWVENSCCAYCISSVMKERGKLIVTFVSLSGARYIFTKVAGDWRGRLRGE